MPSLAGSGPDPLGASDPRRPRTAWPGPPTHASVRLGRRTTRSLPAAVEAFQCHPAHPLVAAPPREIPELVAGAQMVAMARRANE